MRDQKSHLAPKKTSRGEGLDWFSELASHAALLKRLFEEFDSKGILYCLLRNFEGLPDKVDDDIDILVRSDDLDGAERAVRSVKEEFLLIRRIGKNDHLQIYLVSEQELTDAVLENRPARAVLLDFQTRLRWKGVAYMDTESVLATRERYRNFYIAALWYRAAHVLCHAILDKKFFKSGYTTVIWDSVSANGEDSLAPLIPYVGSPMVRRLYSAIVFGGEAKVLRLRGALILRLLFRRVGSVPSSIFFLLRRCLWILRAVLFPPGILIATAGPDGSGKSTLIAVTGRVLSGTFECVRERYMGWKDFVLPTKHLLRFLQKGLGHPGVEGHASEASVPKRQPPWTHNISVLHYFVDLWARYLFQIRPVLARGGVVLCDRYFYDILVQDVWVCRNSWVRTLLLALTPKPTVTAVFTGNPEAIAARKHETSSEETEQQLAKYSVVRNSGAAIVELDAMGSVSANVRSVVSGLEVGTGKVSYS